MAKGKLGKTSIISNIMKMIVYKQCQLYHKLFSLIGIFDQKENQLPVKILESVLQQMQAVCPASG